MTDLLHRLAALLRDRQATYGRPTDQHPVTAQLWNVYLEAKWQRQGGWIPLTASDVCVLNLLQKLSRAACGKPTLDTAMDVMGFGHNWYDCLEREP